MEEKNEQKLENIRDKVLKAWEEGRVCYLTIEGIMSCPLEDFVKQPLAGMLYDLNRDRATLLSFLEDPKWVNDFALTKLLEYYHRENTALSQKNAMLEQSNEHMESEMKRMSNRLHSMNCTLEESGWELYRLKHRSFWKRLFNID